MAQLNLIYVIKGLSWGQHRVSVEGNGRKSEEREEMGEITSWGKHRAACLV